MTAKTFTAFAAAATLGLAAFATARPAQAHLHHHRHVGVIIASVGPAYAYSGTLATIGNVSAPWAVGAGMCVAFKSAFRNHKQRSSPCVCKGRFSVTGRAAQHFA